MSIYQWLYLLCYLVGFYEFLTGLRLVKSSVSELLGIPESTLVILVSGLALMLSPILFPLACIVCIAGYIMRHNTGDG